jgi:hypothetical protein
VVQQEFEDLQEYPKNQATPSDRILVLFGSGHMNLLHILFDASP